MAREVLDQQLVDLRRHLVRSVMANARRGREAITRFDELG
jgi:hypothetical protein